MTNATTTPAPQFPPAAAGQFREEFGRVYRIDKLTTRGRNVRCTIVRTPNGMADNTPRTYHASAFNVMPLVVDSGDRNQFGCPIYVRPA